MTTPDPVINSFIMEYASEDALAALHGETSARRRKPQTKPRGYIKNYKPQAKTEALLRDVEAVLAEYRRYLPLTIRQIFYRLIGAYGYDKTDQFYERLCHHLNLARRARRISFDDIRDDGVSVYQDDWYRDEEHFHRHLQTLAQNYQRDNLARQRVRLEVWCEAAGMLPQLAEVANPFSVPVYSCSGFDSTSARRAIVDRVISDAKDTVILHLGDYDPSGEAIFQATAEDVAAFVAEDRYDARQTVRFKRVALTQWQVAIYRLPTAPAKVTDKRTKNWAERRGSDETCQLEALPPDILADLLREAIEGELDQQQLAADLAEEQIERQRVAYLLTAGGGV